jgi:hypothetical protein
LLSGEEGVRYLFQRIVHNDLQWKGPSIGRRGSLIDGGYLQKTGFAHEDWNFANAATNGFIYGYTYFRPKDIKDRFSIAFATYDKGDQWNLVGYYEDAIFDQAGAPFSNSLLKERALQLGSLRASGDLGGDYKNESVGQIVTRLRDEAEWYRWKVRPSNVHHLSGATPVPPSLLPKNISRYFSRPTDISVSVFASLKKLARGLKDKGTQDNYDDGGDVEFPEGKKLQQLHIKRERSPKLVRLAKASFKEKHGRLFCEVCKFDFESIYGQPGVDFIEAHHTIPVSLLPPGAKTKVSELALVCSNCHRMLHRTRPWRSIPQLRSLVVRRTL